MGRVLERIIRKAARILAEEVAEAVAEKLIEPRTTNRIIANAMSRGRKHFFVTRYGLNWRALKETVDYVEANLPEALCLREKADLWRYALEAVKVEGCRLEFGVFEGQSINAIARLAEGKIIHGFDSFRGLSEDWSGYDIPKGYFDLGGRPPAVRSNVQLHVGWFEETIPRFKADHKEPAAFVHIDCDTYNAVKLVLDLLEDRLVPGTIIVFDEYFNYPGWRRHEFKAFQEFISRTGRKYRYRAYVNREVMVELL